VDRLVDFDPLENQENIIRIFMGRPDQNQDEASIEAACNAPAGTKQDFEIQFSYSLAQLLEDIAPTPGEDSDEPTLTSEQLLQMVNRGVAEDGDRLLMLVNGGRTLGPNYRGVFSINVTAFLDDEEIGSVAMTSPEDTTETITSETIPLEVTAFTESQTLHIPLLKTYSSPPTIGESLIAASQKLVSLHWHESPLMPELSSPNALHHV